MRENILLINPTINPASQNKIINKVINTTFPTSLGVLAGFIMNSGISPVRIIDEQINYIKDTDIEAIILAMEEPRVVGFSVLTINSKRAYELSKKIKAIDPKTIIVYGGIHPTVLPDEALNHNIVDIVVRGEGERAFFELLTNLFNETDFRKVPGLSFKKKGKIIHNPLMPLIENLDEIPEFPFHLFEKDIDRYPTFGSIFTTRGCPYNCIFCSSRSISGKKYRYHSIERVVSEIKLLSEKYRQDSIWLMDDNIAANRKHFIKLLDTIKEEGLHKKVSFHGSMRGDNLSEELLGKIKECNFHMLAFGLETGSECLMKQIDKGETVEEVARAIRMTAEKGISVATTIIFGLPNETHKDRKNAMELVRSLPLSSVRFNTLTPYPGTPVFEKLNQEGKIHIKKNWENFAVQYMWEGDELPFVPDNTNRYELMFDTMYANLSFYLSFNGIKRMLSSSFAGGNVVNLKKRWYLSPKILWDFFLVFTYLSKRFLYITFKMLRKNT